MEFLFYKNFFISCVFFQILTASEAFTVMNASNFLTVNRDLGLNKVVMAEIYLASETNGNLHLVSKDGNAEIVISGEMLTQNNTFHNVVLVCTAVVPIQWIYEGDGAPTRLYSSEIRTVKNFRNESSYEYFSTVVLIPERNNEHFTGTYSCQSINNPEIRTFYHLYFPGQFGFSTIRNRVIRVKRTDTQVVIPCAMTNPKMKMHLYKISPKAETSDWSNNAALTFDPKKGYTFNLEQVTNPYGTYYCSMNDQLSFWKIDIVPPKENEVSVEPNATLVLQENFTNVTFRCSAKEKVELTFPNSQVIGTTQYEYNNDEQFPYSGILRLDATFPLSSMSTFLTINCVTESNRKLLHSWELSSIGEQQLTFKYLANSDKILCCTNSGLSPRYEFVKCETQTDCAIKSNCFTNGRCEYPFPPKYTDAPRGCTAVEFPDRVPTHVAKCSVGDSTSRVVGIIGNIAKSDIIVLEDFRETPPTETILMLTVVKTEKAEVKVKCSGSLFYFAMNFVFIIEHVNGTKETVDPDSIEMLESHEPMLRIVDMDSSVRRIMCFAPLSFSNEWRNVSMPVAVAEPTKTESSLSSSSRSTNHSPDGARRRRHRVIKI